MSSDLDRRTLLQLLGLGGVVLGSGLPGFSLAAGKGPATKQQDFFFLQLSDTHWGFKGPPNPEADHTLKDAVQAINASRAQPDFIVFTGDLTHTTDDDALRRKRMQEFKTIASFSYDCKLRIFLNDPLNSCSQDGMIICQYDTILSHCLKINPEIKLFNCQEILCHFSMGFIIV